MVQGSEVEPEQPFGQGRTPPPAAGAPSTQPATPPYYYPTAANESGQGVPTPPGPFVRPSTATPPQASPPQPPAQPQQPQQPYTGGAAMAPRQPAPPPGYAPQAPQPAPRMQQPAAPQAAPPTQVPRGPAPIARNIALRCPNCGGPVTSETEICPTCGEALQEKPRMVRCRHCGGKGSNRLTICPHCGRTLRPAPSRWLTIGLPAALGLLLLALIAFQSDSGNPLGWTADRIRGASAWLTNFTAGLDPQLEVIPAAEPDVLPLPTAPVGVPPTAETVAQAAPASTTVFTATAPVGAIAAPAADTAAGAAVTATAPLTAANSAAPAAATAQPTANALPTETPLPTATPAATATSVATATPASIRYTVVRGDAAQAIAARFGITLEELLLANNLTESEATLLQPGQTLTIPAPGSSAGEAAGAIYTVRQGDTLSGIAVRTGVAVRILQQANNLSDAQAASLQPGDRLIIPAPTPLPTQTPAPTAPPTAAPPTAIPPTAAPTIAAAPVAATPATAMRHPAPVLRAPPNGAVVVCSAGGLQWEPTTGIQADESYRVHLGFVSGRDAQGNAQITWLIQQDIPSNITQVSVPATFCDKSSAELGNEWRWYVEVVAKSGTTTVPVSPTSSVWGFVWKD